MDALKLHDVVALLVDLPDQKLLRGDVGTIVEVFDETAHHPSGFIVEVVNESGEVGAQADIADAAQLIKLRFNFQREAA